MKSLASACAATSFAIPAVLAMAVVALLALLIVVATALFSKKNGDRAITVLRILVIPVCVLLYWLHS